MKKFFQYSLLMSLLLLGTQAFADRPKQLAESGQEDDFGPGPDEDDSDNTDEDIHFGPGPSDVDGDIHFGPGPSV